MKINFKEEKGYVDCGDVIVILTILLTIAFFVFMLAALLGNLCLDFASGNHRITPTAVDTDMWGNYKVYYRTSQYTQNSQEDYYYIDKDDTELAEQMKEYVKQGKEVVVYYDKYVGFKGISAPCTSPIIKIELIEE